MQEFFEIATTDFAATFEGAWMLPLLLLSAGLILWKEPDWTRKILLGGLPLAAIFIYWFLPTGMLLMKLLGENIYWRILWLILLAVTIPYALCLLLRRCRGLRRQAAFLLCLVLLALCGTPLLASEEFLDSTNEYKIPQYVIDVCELLPENIHAVVSNRLLPYIRLYDTSITLEYARNAFVFVSLEEGRSDIEKLYLEMQEDEIDLSVLAPLAKSEGCTFIVLSNTRTYIGEWEDNGYTKYASTDEFDIFVDMDYEEGEDTRKWID
ncbi:MAG: hypothetical protein LUE24_10705 [Lachnospiraceae bacterium]|nr:hypothetical protein [Lachnospiraceae bacterium]